jgi:hypothetical protein
MEFPQVTNCRDSKVRLPAETALTTQDTGVAEAKFTTKELGRVGISAPEGMIEVVEAAVGAKVTV